MNATIPSMARMTFILAIAALLALAMSSCSPGPWLPAAARQALEQAWNAIPGEVGDLHIVRAWSGKGPAEELTPWAPDMQTWCVEVKPPADPGAAASPELAIWVVTKPDAESDWSAGMLLTMSSLWPYQACEPAP